MRKRSDRIQRIVTMTEREERRECQTMGRAQKRLDEEVDRLGELESYRRIYAREHRPGGNVSPTRWQDYQNFLQRLDQAVAAQKAQVLSGEQNRDAHRKRWMAKRQKLDSLERIVERYRQEEDADLEKRLQRTLDDMPAKGDFFDPN